MVLQNFDVSASDSPNGVEKVLGILTLCLILNFWLWLRKKYSLLENIFFRKPVS